jgi:predicted nucleic acid-binding protein
VWAYFDSSAVVKVYVQEGGRAAVLRQFAKDRTQWNLLAVSTEILERAEQIVASHTVRTLDAIHIASAQEFAERLQARVPFISADHRQIAAAAAAGLIVQQVGP